MACFIVPTVEAVVVTAVSYGLKKSEEKKQLQLKTGNAVGTVAEKKTGISWSRKLSWLSGLLWGGALLLAFEHVWHGEVVPWFPFLTAMNNPEDTAEMLHEMATVGVTMAGIVTAAWVGICIAAESIVKRKPTAVESPAKA